MAAVDRKIIGHATLMIMSSVFLSVDTARILKYVWPFFGHMYRLLFLQKMKIKQTENNVVLYILQKYCSKEKFRKIRNFYRKKGSCWHNIFKVGMVFSGEIYDKAFYQMILLNVKTFRSQKRIRSSC